MVRIVIVLSIIALLSLPGFALPFNKPSDDDVIKSVNEQIKQKLDQILSSDSDDEVEEDRKKRESSLTSSPNLETSKDDYSNEKTNDDEEDTDDDEGGDIKEERRKRSIFDEISSIGSSASYPSAKLEKIKNERTDDEEEEGENDIDTDDNDRRKRNIDSQIREDENDEGDIRQERRKRNTETEINYTDDDDDDDYLLLERRKKRDANSGFNDDDDDRDDDDDDDDYVGEGDLTLESLKKKDSESGVGVEVDNGEEIDDEKKVERKKRDAGLMIGSDENEDGVDSDDLTTYRRKRDAYSEMIDEEDEDDSDIGSTLIKRSTESVQKYAGNVHVAPVDESGKVLITRIGRDISEMNKDVDNVDKTPPSGEPAVYIVRKERDLSKYGDGDGSEMGTKKIDLQTGPENLSIDDEDSDDDEADDDDANDDDDKLSERRKRETEFINFDDDEGLDEDYDDNEDTTPRLRRMASVKPNSTARPPSNTTSVTPSSSTTESLLQTFLRKSAATKFTASSSNDDADKGNETDDEDEYDDDNDDDDEDEKNNISNKNKELEKQLRSLVKSVSKQKRDITGYAPRYTDADDDLQKNDFLSENKVPETKESSNQTHTRIHIAEPSDFDLHDNSKETALATVDVHPRAPEVTQHTSSNGLSLASTKQMGGEPFGPIATKRSVEQQYSAFFTKNAKRRVAWVEPKMMQNCWAQEMLASRFGYSPSCNADGSFSPKQCFLERCWCVHRDGSPQDPNVNTRFVFSVAAIMMECTQNP
ncbi:protein starmaker-like [Ylistrum balloti]|uniref:protein starmaker-like n=1 Tax=Ylistrum balloti TaxID=509963 RepID=UPI0029059729|nr:protein starmaker-like [Ylistrum balloti]